MARRYNHRRPSIPVGMIDVLYHDPYRVPRKLSDLPPPGTPAPRDRFRETLEILAVFGGMSPQDIARYARNC